MLEQNGKGESGEDWLYQIHACSRILTSDSDVNAFVWLNFRFIERWNKKEESE